MLRTLLLTIQLRNYIYLYQKADLGGISNYMKPFLDTFISTDPYKNSVEQNWLLFKGAIHEALEKYIPKHHIKTSRCIPWIKHMHAIKLKIKERKQLYDRAKKIQTHESWEAYRIIRNQVTQEISEAHTNYQTQIFENNICTVSIKDFGSI